MSVLQALRNAGGVTRTSVLRGLGFSQHDLRQAVQAGSAVRPHRGWIALPNADPALLFAAQHNVVLSCITQAKRLGLWVLEHDRPHVVGSLSARHTSAPDCTVHWRKPLILRKPAQLTDSIENTLDAVAACQPHDAALAIWDSALQKRLIDYPALASLPLRGQSLELLNQCTPFADSGLETMFRTRFRWLKVAIRPQAWVHGHRVDFLIGDRLIVQIDGKQHLGTQRASDMAHDAVLAQRGYTVIRVSYAQVVHEWPQVESQVLGAVARGLHLSR